MNIDNIKATIAILQRAHNFDISDFQSTAKGNWRFVETEEELHTCGNSACIAGYVAVSPEWKAFGGKIEMGEPRLPEHNRPEKAMSQYWGLPSPVVEAIIYGMGDFIGEDEDEQYLEWVEVLEGQGVNRLTLPSLWSDLTKEQAISIFEQLLAAKAPA